ncbi:hypothetical protein D9Q98_003989 [Chlorella vulgaris]|uniref:YEATS domain-containing protein n=1 Tax=Chlorella vulgaris TaxID=3077 RepID=A0A9D4TRF8_CHLVU|nr:hypothetical protein D9Q98_003989 [Chlorella vulgaris]
MNFACDLQDDVILSFQARHAESRAEAATHQEQLESARQQLQASQLRVHELVESRNRQRQQVEQAATAAAAAAQEIVRLKAEACRAQPLQDRLMLLEQQAEHSTTDLEATHRQLAVLSATVDAANDAIVDLQALLEERDEDVAVRDAELAALRLHLDNTFQNSAGCEPVADEAAACRIAALEVTFVLHESFQNPRRDVEMPPYELTETGWGEFDIVVVLHFRDDVKEGPLELYHRLKLYDDAGVSNPKKPVVLEMYDEVVLWQPIETF